MKRTHTGWKRTLGIAAFAALAWTAAADTLARVSIFDPIFNFFQGGGSGVSKEIRISGLPKTAQTACSLDLPSCVTTGTCDNARMFLKANKRIKDGKVHYYWTLVESVRAGRRVFQRQGKKGKKGPDPKSGHKST